jgi:hypothetical protein
MEIYLVVLGLILLLSFGVEIGRQADLKQILVIRGKEYSIIPTEFLWIGIALAFVIFGGIRYGIGDDYFGYRMMFEDLCENWNDPARAGTEQGFVWLNRIVSLYTQNADWIIFITNAIVSITGVWCIRKFSKFTPISLFIFYTTIYYQAFNLVRQGMAAAMIFLAFGYVKEKKWIRGMIWTVLAFYFHKTSLIMLPLFFLMSIKYNPIFYLIFFSVSCVCFLLKENISSLLISFYPYAVNDGEAYMYSSISPTQIALSGIYMVLAWIYYKPLLEKDDGNILYINFSILMFGLYSCFFWIPLWGRLQLYFICLYALIIPEIISCESDKRLRFLYYLVIWGLLAFFYIVPMALYGVTWPYKTIFG